ncbi:MAG: hypothetical protein ACKOZV_00710, partial [Bacteroidota bacterium]
TVSTTVTGVEVGSTMFGARILENVISGVENSNTGGWSAAGIILSSTVFPTNILIANNMISDVKTINYVVNSTFNAAGIRLNGGINTRVYNNSVNLFGDVTVGTGSSSSYCMYIASSSVNGADIRNNIFTNTTNFGAAGSITYSVALSSTLNPVPQFINNNNYSGASTATTTYRVGYNGSVGFNTLADWRNFTTQDQNSLAVAPSYVSNTDLHLQSATSFCLDGAGANLNPPVSIDIDCDARGTTPDIGADEITTQLSIAVAETSGVANNDGIICAGASATLTATSGTGYTYLWSQGSTTASITVSPATTSTYTVTITQGGCSKTATYTVTVNPLPTPTVAVTETSGIANNDGITCSGASATLTASGGTSYLW